MAVGTGDVIVPGVDLVAEGDGLFGSISLVTPEIIPEVAADHEDGQNKNQAPDSTAHGVSSLDHTGLPGKPEEWIGCTVSLSVNNVANLKE